MSNRPLTRQDWAIDDGWVPIVEPVVALLIKLSCTITQVKEKFGGLRIYFDYGETTPLDVADGIVRLAERLAERTCETCGAVASGPDAPQGTYWLKTLCDACVQQREREAK